ncbi:MAG: hypothetical protein ACRCW9_03165 [Cetobacterium sp.]
MKTTQFKFDSFTGSDIQIRLTFPYKDDTDKLHIINVANISAIGGQIQVEGTPRYVMGQADPAGYSQGKRLITGSFVIETMNSSFMADLQKVMPADYFKVVLGITEEEIDTNTAIPISKMAELQYADQIPLFNIEIIAIKEDNPSIRARRTIEGCKIFSEASGIGLSSLDTQESIQFMAKEISPFEKIKA